MWYRFNFSAEYDGDLVKFDQYVYCGYARTPYVSAQGGTATPARPITKRVQPETIAKTMSDGSQLLLRVPDVCDWHRSGGHKAEKDQPRDPFGRPHWLSLGSFEVLPLVIWSDKTPVENDASTQPELVEFYVGRGYYTNTHARLKNPSGSITFMKAGFVPQNFEKTITQKRIFPTLRYKTTNIYTKKVQYSDWQSGIHPEFETYYILPISDIQTYYEKNKNFGRPYQDVHGEERRVDLAPEKPKEIEDQENPFFEFYEYNGDFEKGDNSVDPDYLPPEWAQKCLWQMVSEGDPSYTDIPNITEDIRFRARSYPGEDTAHERERQERNDRIRARRENCFKNLDNIESFDVVNGRLDPSLSLPGMISFRRWNRRDPNATLSTYNGIKYGYRFIPEFLINKGVVENGIRNNLVYKLRINGNNLNVRNFGMYVIKDKKGKWYIIGSSSWPLSLNLSEEEDISQFYYSPDCCSETDR